MAEQQPPPAPIPVEIQASLHAISRLLREAHHLGPEAQERLAELVDELGTAIGSAQVSPAELALLTENTEKLIAALHERHESGLLAGARDRLEAAAAGIEARAPLVAGVTRRLLDALSGIGI
jgi:hypothetical protein